MQSTYLTAHKHPSCIAHCSCFLYFRSTQLAIGPALILKLAAEMGTFSFAKGRKKPPPQLVLSEPMSKAHKILGSTPLNIDSPKAWDDASSGFSGGTADSTLHSFAAEGDDISDHQVTIASDDGWANESDILPALTEAADVAAVPEYSRTDISGTLRKTQSSSTIRSWYDRSTQPLSVSQQTSSSAIAKGTPSKAHRMLDFDGSAVDRKAKKKPPMLDFSNLGSSKLTRKSSHPQLRTDGTLMNYSDGMQSTSIMSPTMGKRVPRKIQKRLTKDSLISPIAASPQTEAMSSRRRGSSSKEIPSLYDHYEQMTLRQFADEHIGEEDEHIENTKSGDAPVQFRRGSKEHFDTQQDTPHTTANAASQHNRSISMSSKATRTSKASKGTDHDLDDANLQETSVLLLSSGSEDEAGVEDMSRNKVRTSTPVRRSSEDANVSPRTNPVRRSAATPQPSAVPRRSSKRTSFAPANTYITIPSANEERAKRNVVSPTDSRSSTPHEFSTQGTPCRMSLMSNLSNTSGLTIRGHDGHIEEARAITMLPARRPSKVEFSCKKEHADTDASRSSSLPLQYESMSSPEQLTPPLSPTSVDFYIRSARSSIDGICGQSRFMAVSRQEEMLLSALRQKHRHEPERPASETSHGASEEVNEKNAMPHEKRKPTSEILIADASNFDFGFPVPPSARRQSFGNVLHTAASSSQASLSNAEKLSQSSVEEFGSIDDEKTSALSPAPLNQALPKGILKQPAQPPEETEQEDVILYLDQGEPSPDLSDFQDFGYLASGSFQDPPSEQNVQDNRGFPHFSNGRLASSQEAKCSDIMLRARMGMASVPEDSELEEDEDDMPRPDSPVSPDAFPAVPQVRTTLSSIARLSAFGPAPLLNEPSWGDDD